MFALCHKLPSSALGRLLAHIEKCTIAWAPHREGSCMSGEGVSTLAHRMINDVLRTSRRRFLTQVGAAGLGIGVPVSIIAAGTQAPWPIREPNGGEFESFWPYLIRGA